MLKFKKKVKFSPKSQRYRVRQADLQRETGYKKFLHRVMKSESGSGAPLRPNKALFFKKPDILIKLFRYSIPSTRIRHYFSKSIIIFIKILSSLSPHTNIYPPTHVPAKIDQLTGAKRLSVDS